METKEIFIPITLESIEPLIFPDVALYIKTGGNLGGFECLMKG